MAINYRKLSTPTINYRKPAAPRSVTPELASYIRERTTDPNRPVYLVAGQSVVLRAS